MCKNDKPSKRQKEQQPSFSGYDDSGESNESSIGLQMTNRDSERHQQDIKQKLFADMWYKVRWYTAVEKIEQNIYN